MALAQTFLTYFENFTHSRSIVITLLVLLFVHLFRTYRKLANIPGPILCTITNLPRVSWVLGNSAHDKHIELHRKYGPLVRFGPNMVSVSSPSEIQKIYGFSSKFAKSDFYHALLFYARGKPVPTIFATQDDNLHKTLKKPIAAIYSMSNLLSFERYVDSTLKVFFTQLDKRFVEGDNICDLGSWLQMFAFDVMGEITFSKRLGFLESAGDIDDLMTSIWSYFKNASPVSQIPWFDWFWAKNPIFQRLKSVKANPIVAFAVARAKERQEGSSSLHLDSKDKTTEMNSRDFLSRFLEVLDKDKDIPPWALTAWTVSNIAAGSDTTAILLRTLFHNLLIHPESMKSLLSELKEATADNQISDPVSWKEAKALPYLDGCIKEAGRIHPPFGLPLERVVPPGGAVISGQHFAGGTVVGMNAWAVHRDFEVFGRDSDEWRPERWLCEEPRRRKMENALLTFGAGNRSCLGKNISYLEVYKLVPSIIRRYEIELANPTDGDWRVQNRWFVNQTGLNVRMKKRSCL